MKILIKKDGNGFLAEVEGANNIFAWDTTKKKHLKNLLMLLR